MSYSARYEFFELFAGEGKVTQAWSGSQLVYYAPFEARSPLPYNEPRHKKGYATASFDKLYGDPMDFLKNCGFTNLGFRKPVGLATHQPS